MNAKINKPSRYLLTSLYDDDYMYADGGWFQNNWKNVLMTGAGIGAMFIPGMQGVGAGMIGSGVGGMISGLGEGEEEDVNYINDAEAPKVIGTKYNTPNVMSFKDGGDIHIKKSKRGTFTSAAKKRGMGVQEFARKVLASKSKYSDAMVKKANFARNAAKWNKQDGGPVDAITGADIPINEEAYYYNEFFGPISDKLRLLANKSKEYGNPAMDLKATAGFMDLGDYSDEPNLYKLKGIRPELGEDADMTQAFINSLSEEQIGALAKKRDKGIKGNISLIRDLKLKPEQILPALTAYKYGKRNEMFADGGRMPLTRFEGKKHEEGGIRLQGAEVEDDETMFNNIVNSDREYMKITEEMAKQYNLDKKAIGKTPAEYSKMIDDEYKDNEYFGENTRIRRLDNLSRLSIDLSEKQKEKQMNKLQDGGPKDIPSLMRTRKPFRNLAYRRLGNVPLSELMIEADRLRSEYFGQGFDEDFSTNRTMFYQKYFPDYTAETEKFIPEFGNDYLSELYSNIPGYTKGPSIDGIEAMKRYDSVDRYPFQHNITGEGEVTATTKGSGALPSPVRNISDPAVTGTGDIERMEGVGLNFRLGTPTLDKSDTRLRLDGLDTSRIKERDISEYTNEDNDFNLSDSEGLTDLMGLAPIALTAFQAARAGNRTPEEVRYNPIKPQDVHPELIDPTYTLQNVTDTFDTALEGMDQVSRKDYLRRRTQLATEEAKAKGQALGQIRNANRMMINQADQYNASQQLRADSINAELGMRVEDINAANEAAIESTRDMHLSNLATMLGQRARDVKLDAANERYYDRVFDILPELFPGLNFSRTKGYSPDKLSIPVDTSSVWGGTGLDVPQYSINKYDYPDPSGLDSSFAPNRYGYRLPYGHAGYLREPNISRRLSLNPYLNE